MANTGMTKAEAETLAKRVRQESTLTGVAVETVGRRSFVTASDGTPAPINFASEAEWDASPLRDAGLPARRQADAERQYGKLRLAQAGERIVGDGTSLVELLRRTATRIEDRLANLPTQLAFPEDATPTEAQIVATQARVYQYLAQALMDELDWVNPARFNRDTGRTLVDLGEAKAEYLAILARS